MNQDIKIIREMIDMVKNPIQQKQTTQDESLDTLYHGSKFSFNKFDLGRVNTGQRSQDFGYGLYFTSDKDTAKFYANELSNTKTPIQKYDEIIKNNKRNDMLYQYLSENRVASAERIVTGLIDKKVGDISEWQELLRALNIVQRYGYLYTVTISNPNFIERNDYIAMQRESNLNDQQMNKILTQQGFNGIKYKINSFGLSKASISSREFNVVIINDNIIHMQNSEKVDFEGTLKLDYIK